MVSWMLLVFLLKYKLHPEPSSFNFFFSYGMAVIFFHFCLRFLEFDFLQGRGIFIFVWKSGDRLCGDTTNQGISRPHTEDAGGSNSGSSLFIFGCEKCLRKSQGVGQSPTSFLLITKHPISLLFKFLSSHVTDLLVPSHYIFHEKVCQRGK